MIEISYKTSATIAFSPAHAPEFYDLPPHVAGVLAQFGASVVALDLGFRGDSFRYASDLAEVTVRRRPDGPGLRQITVTCDTIANGSPTCGRQLCFQIVRRLISRLRVSSVFWQPTRHRLTPNGFTWDAVADVSHRVAAQSSGVVPADREISPF